MSATETAASAADNAVNEGRIVRVIGPVVDVEFPPGELPEINNALHFTRTVGDESKQITAEVAQHIGDRRVRAICMAPTDGVVRGTDVQDTGAPISVPVGPSVLGHIYNVLGEPLDLQGAERENFEAEDRWPIHREAPDFDDLEPQSKRDRHQGHRPDRAVRGGRQGRHVRWCWCGQDRHHPGDDLARRRGARRCVGVRRRR